MMIKYILAHLLAFLAGYILDLYLGDDLWLLHPVRVIGLVIASFEKKLNKKKFSDKKRRVLGSIFAVLLTLSVCLIMAVFLIIGYRAHILLGALVDTLFTWSTVAQRDLKKESMRVYHDLKLYDSGLGADGLSSEQKTGELSDGQKYGLLNKARQSVSMIVGRDTERLSKEEIIKAAVETVAESTSDGIIAPMFYLFLGGPILGMAYKAINTMDSMIGYKNKRYLFYGRTAAKMDDVVNYLPARLTAFLMIISTMICRAVFAPGEKKNGAFPDYIYNYKNAIKVYRRDKDKSTSPNSGRPESVMAGALGLKLLGNAYYFGKLVKKETIGDGLKSPETEDIKRANNVTWISGNLFAILVIVFAIVPMLIIYMH